LPAIIGGEMQLTAVDPAGISCRTIGKFPDFEQTYHAAAAVTARLLRGDAVVDVRDGLVAVEEIVTAPGASRAERRRAEKLDRKAAKRHAA
jgi:hypothetical protein